MKTTNKVLYAATIEEFQQDVEKGVNEIVNSMQDCSFENGISVSETEPKSWAENIKALQNLFKEAKLPKNVVVAFEYQIPIGGGRIDCMLYGHGEDGKANIVHIEMKQWSNENVSPFYDHYTFHVVVDGYRSGTEYPTHPSRQVSGYHNCLLNYMKVFEGKEVNLHGMVYCYNYLSTKEPRALLDDFYVDDMKNYPVFCKDQKEELAMRLKSLIGCGKGEEIFSAFINSEICPTQRLYDVAANIFDNLDDKAAEKIFALVGDQVDTYNNILGAVKKTKKDEKTVIIVKGGPGTGKSVIALRLLSELYKEEYNCRNVYYATRSTSLLHGWQNVLCGVARRNGKGDVSSLIQSTFDFKPYRFGNKENGGDVLLVDEAHRIEYKSNNKTDSNRADDDRSYLSQIMSLLYSFRVCVFFIDDKQSIKPSEIGTSTIIRKAAENYQQRMQEETDYFFNKSQKEVKRERKIIEKQLSIARLNDNYGKLKELQESLERIDLLLKLSETKSDYENQLVKIKEKLIGAEAVCNTDKVQKLIKDEKRIERMLKLPRLIPQIQKIDVLKPFELTDQFRCNGSNNYLYWLDQLLYESNSPDKIKLNTDSYEFDIFDNPNALYAKIRSLDEYALFADEFEVKMQDGFSYKLLQDAAKSMEFKQSARLIAGWCWKWDQKTLESNGDLEHEIIISNSSFKFEMPWETASSEGAKKPKGDMRLKYAKDADSWCNQKEGVNQVGCIHSIQGWETDYVGVIIGPDLMWDGDKNCLCYNPEGNNHNLPKYSSEKNNQLILNTYRVLLTRGKKGCFIYCCDPQVADYFKRCMNQ